jgi:hypothetical protein
VFESPKRTISHLANARELVKTKENLLDSTWGRLVTSPSHAFGQSLFGGQLGVPIRNDGPNAVLPQFLDDARARHGWAPELH